MIHVKGQRQVNFFLEKNSFFSFGFNFPVQSHNAENDLIFSMDNFEENKSELTHNYEQNIKNFNYHVSINCFYYCNCNLY